MTPSLMLNRHGNNLTIASLKSGLTFKLIKGILGSRLLISSLPGEALGILVES